MNADELQGLDLPRDVVTLAVSASSWMADAMGDWATGDYAKVGLHAPLAVEHLGKAVLWNRNPVLVVPLTSKDEPSLILLATNPSLRPQTLKTIGLRIVIDRVEKVFASNAPLLPASKDQLVNVRNGITHVGTADLSRQVLLDALTVTNRYLKHLGIDEATFYGSNVSNVAGLLDEKQTEIGHRVLEKRAAARQRILTLEESLGEAEYLATARRLEEQREYLADPAGGLGSDVEAVDQDCPVCQSTGRLFGPVELEAQMDYDVEPIGGGHYEPVPMPYWEIWFAPHGFECVVCHLSLVGSEELSLVDIGIDRRDVSPEDLGEGFDLDELIRNEYGPDDF